MYELDLALNNLQELICCETQLIMVDLKIKLSLKNVYNEY